MTFTFLTTRVSRVHALEPPLRLQAIPDRLAQGPQQEVARLETWIANIYPGCFPKCFCRLKCYRHIFIAVDFLRTDQSVNIVVNCTPNVATLQNGEEFFVFNVLNNQDQAAVIFWFDVIVAIEGFIVETDQATDAERKVLRGVEESAHDEGRDGCQDGVYGLWALDTTYTVSVLLLGGTGG